MSGIGGEIIIIFFLILASGIFAMAEMAVITARKSRLDEWVKKGRRRAGVVLDLAQTPNRFLSTVQIGITFVAILVGVFAGRNTADWMATLIQRVPVIGDYHNEIALGLVVLTITYLALVIGELVPKRLALRYPEKIATALAIPLRLFTQVCAPMVGLLNLSTDAVCRLFGSQHPNEPRLRKRKSKCSCVKPPRQASSRSRSKICSRRCCASAIRARGH